VRTCGGWRGGKPNPCDGYVGLNAALELFAFVLDECSRLVAGGPEGEGRCPAPACASRRRFEVRIATQPPCLGYYTLCSLIST
jgi:hypothetical protein